MPRPEIDLAADDIVDAAIGILDEQGLDAVSMRSVATRLGVSPVPLYRRVGDKEALLGAMAERVLAGMAPEADVGEPWQSYAIRWAHAVRRRLAETADVRLVVGSSRSPFVEASKPLIDTLRAQGFSAGAAVQATRLLLWAVAGFAATEPGGRRVAATSGATAAEAEHLFTLHIRYLVDGIERDR